MGAERRGLLGLPWLTASFNSSERSYLKDIKQRVVEQDTQCRFHWLHTHTYLWKVCKWDKSLLLCPVFAQASLEKFISLQRSPRPPQHCLFTNNGLCMAHHLTIFSGQKTEGRFPAATLCHMGRLSKWLLPSPVSVIKQTHPGLWKVQLQNKSLYRVISTNNSTFFFFFWSVKKRTKYVQHSVPHTVWLQGPQEEVLFIISSCL